MKKYLLFTISILLSAVTWAQALMPLPEVPDGVPLGRQRANYIVEHFWDKMPWKKAYTMPGKMETTLRDFARLLPHATADTAYLSIGKLINGASKKAENFKALIPMAEATFHSDTAMLYSDDVYLPFAQAAAKYKKFNKAERERYARQAQIIETSAQGKTLPGLQIARRDTTTFALNDTTSGAQSYVIIIETAESGRFDRVEFAANIAARRLVTAGLLKPILIYAGEASEDWWSSTLGLPEQWSIGQLPDAEEYFDLRATPAIYLVDPHMVVVTKWMPMPSLINNCEQLIQTLQKQSEQQ